MWSYQIILKFMFYDKIEFDETKDYVDANWYRNMRFIGGLIQVIA